MTSVSSFTRSAWRAATGVLLVAGSVLAPASSIQAAELTPTPNPVLTPIASADEIYPRATTEVEIQPGLRVRPLKSVILANGRSAVADRLIVVLASRTLHRATSPTAIARRPARAA
jgi:hypothetical protein